MNRKQTAVAMSHLMPYIIQGAHLGAMNMRSITQSQFLILVMLHTNGTCSMNSLASKMQVQLPTMSGMVNRLVKSDYLTRIVKEEDRRHVWISLTPKGKDFLEQFQGILRKRWEDVLAILDEREVKKFYLIVDKLIKKLGDV